MQMNPKETIYILGSGAIGFPLAACLTNAGRMAVAVRTSRTDVPKSTVTITMRNGEHQVRTPIETVSLSELPALHGTIVIAAKAYANEAIARQLKDKSATGPIVVLQNGVGVEKAFVDARFPSVYRCVLYITSQAISEYEFAVRPVTASPTGVIRGDESGLEECVENLNTEGFPFRPEANIQREIWKKAIANAVFNSICPLLEVDNGIFARNEAVADLAREVVSECVALTGRLGLGLNEAELMEQILRISRASDGQLISTLQDIRSGRQTEMDFLNLEMTRVAASMQPVLPLPRVEFLGKMILAKSSRQRGKKP
jgi:2-dehydropantoate 2-reductase